MAHTDVSAEGVAGGLSQTCSAYLEAHRAKLAQAMEDGQRGIDVASGFAGMFDGLFRLLFDAARKQVGQRKRDGRVATVAVGGYGRGLVAPHSDVDIVFLCDDPGAEWVVPLAEAMLYPLWDCGVDVGHAVRGLSDSLELSRVDIRTATTLLDLRHVAGDASLTEELIRRGREEIVHGEQEAFISALSADTLRRHERYGGTLYTREPELKWGRGGLRDLDVVTWVGRARWNVNDLEGLVAAGGMTENEWLDLRSARDHLWAIRNHLHALARRRQDRLTFEDQEVVASRLGYRDTVMPGVEQFMQVYYRHARVIARAVDGILERARRVDREPTTVRDLGRGLMVQDGQVVMDDSRLHEDPCIALRLYRAVVRERLPPAPQSRDAVYGVTHERDWCQSLRREPESGALFLDLITEAERSPVGQGSVLNELHDQGLMLAMIPEFEPIMGRAPHDSYFAYTADAQSIKAVDYLHSIVRGERAAEYHDVSRAAAEMPRPTPLYLALLLHAVGASHPDDPAGYAAAVAGHIARRLGLQSSAVRHVQWLIGMQDAFYTWATRRDINDPDTIAEVASEAQTMYRLRDLYLFTFANVATANPTAMTAWNARMFQDLWQAVSDALEGREQDSMERLMTEVLESVEGPEEREQVRDFLAEMPARYLHANTATGILFHCRAGQRPDDRPVVAATPSGIGDDTLELLVVADDHPGLLAQVAAALAGCKFDLDSAQLYTRKRADGRVEAFDIFHISSNSPADEALLDRHLKDLQISIEKLVSGEWSAEKLLTGRSASPSWARTGPRIKTDINIDNSASGTYTVVDVFTRARGKLLYTIAKELYQAGLSIGLAKVNTEGDRVADVFYVVTETGNKLEDHTRVAQLCDRLRRAIHALDRA